MQAQQPETMNLVDDHHMVEIVDSSGRSEEEVHHNIIELGSTNAAPQASVQQPVIDLHKSAQDLNQVPQHASTEMQHVQNVVDQHVPQMQSMV